MAALVGGTEGGRATPTGRHAMRGTHARGRLALLAACATSLAGAVSVAQAQDGDLDGFTPSNAAKQREYEARFQQRVSADDLGRLNRRFSRRPHLVGTPNQARVVESALARLRSYGLDEHTQSYDVWLSRPNSIQVSMTKPYLRTATVKEKPMPWSQDFEDVVVGYNTYSPPGDVTARSSTRTTGCPRITPRWTSSASRRGQDRARPLRAKLPRRQGARRRGARRQGRDHLLGSRGRRLRARARVSGGAVAPGGFDSARKHPVHLGLPGRPADARRAVRAGNTEARSFAGDRHRQDPEHADLLRRRGAAVALADRAGGARGLPGRPRLPVPRRPRGHRGTAQPRHRLRDPARHRRDRGDPRDDEAGREGHRRRPLGRMDLRGQRQRERLQRGVGDRALARQAAPAWLAAREDDRAGRLGRRGVRPARLDRVGRAVRG